MPPDRLSPLDASFLAVEGPTAHMHVGWAAYFDPPETGPRPDFPALAAHIAARLAAAPRWHQRLVGVPLGVHEPVWEDDPAYDPADHLHEGGGGSLGALAERVLSVPLPRDRPLWDMWIVPELEDGRMGIVGKAHHCMVDGVGALELAAVLLDREPEPAPPPPSTAPRRPPAHAMRARRSGSPRRSGTAPARARRWSPCPSASRSARAPRSAWAARWPAPPSRPPRRAP